jgi:hypothetical protein
LAPNHDTPLLIQDYIPIRRRVRPSIPNAAQQGPSGAIGISDASMFENHPFEDVRAFSLATDHILDGEHSPSEVLDESIWAKRYNNRGLCGFL